MSASNESVPTGGGPLFCVMSTEMLCRMQFAPSASEGLFLLKADDCGSDNGHVDVVLTRNEAKTLALRMLEIVERAGSAQPGETT